MQSSLPAIYTDTDRLGSTVRGFREEKAKRRRTSLPPERGVCRGLNWNHNLTAAKKKHILTEVEKLWVKSHDFMVKFPLAVNDLFQAVTVAKQMLDKISFPREALILAKMGEVFFNFAIKFILILALFLWYRISVTWIVFLAPVTLIHLVILGTFFGLLLAPLGALYNDVSKSLTLNIGFWLFLTLVVYPVARGGGLATLVQMNPVTPLLATTRELATTGVVSNPYGYWVASLIAVVELLLAWIIYRLAMPFVVERISS